MRRKAGVAALVIILMLGVALAACSKSGSGGGDSPSQSSSVAPGGEPVKIMMWDRLGGPFQTNLLALADQFNKIYPNIKVEVNFIAPGDYTAAVQAAISGGNLPDIFMNGAVPLQQLVELNLVHDLEDFIPPNKRNEWVDGTWNEGQTTVNGKIYVLPHATSTYSSLLFYNKDMLQKAGYSASDLSKHLSYEQFIDIAKKTMAANPGTYGFIFPGTIGWITDIYFEQMATVTSPDAVSVAEQYLFNYKTGQFANNAPGLLDSIGFLKQTKDIGIAHPNSMIFNGSEARSAFMDGKAAFMLDNTGNISVYPAKTDKIGAIYAPSKDGKPTYRGDQGWAGGGIEVNKNTKHYNEVKMFLGYFVDKFGQLMADSYGPGLPTVKQSQYKSDWELYNTTVKINDETWIPAPNPVVKNKYALDVMTEVSKHMPTTTLPKVFQGYMTGQVTDLKAALDKQNADMNQVFQEAIKTVSGSGHKVSQQDFMFGDWTPFKPYVNK